MFALLPKLLERTGTSEHGTITALYTVLVDGDDMNEPVADAVRSILDGHIVLSRKLAAANHYPAIDVLASVSRVMPDVVTPAHNAAASTVRDILATYKDAEDLVNIGAYVAGSNPRVDHALARIDAGPRRSCARASTTAPRSPTRSARIAEPRRDGLMKGFRFRLDPVLGHRERVEHERAGEHARALAAQLAAERARDDAVRPARRDARASLRDGHAALDAETLRATYAHLGYLDRAIRAAQQRADACAAETARSQARLIEAARDRKVLETLKDRRREAFAHEASLAEQRELDDQNARLFDRANPFEGLTP